MESEINEAKELCNNEVASANEEYQSTQEQIKALLSQVRDIEQDRAKHIESKRSEIEQLEKEIEFIKSGEDVRDAYNLIKLVRLKYKRNMKMRYKKLVNRHKTGEIDSEIRALILKKESIEKEALYGETTAWYDDKIKAINEQVKRVSENSYALQNVSNVRISKAREKYEATYSNAEKHRENATAVYNALVESYSEMLDPRDWKSIDMIIYNFETNRADTIKEALLLVDTEQRNNALMGTIRSAANAISNTIRDEMAYTRSSISASISVLSNKISSYAGKVSKLSSAINTQSESLTAINSGINKIIDQAVLSSALTEKANATSFELVDNVKKLVKIAEGI